MANIKTTLQILATSAFTDANNTEIYPTDISITTNNDSILKRVKLEADVGKLIFESAEYGRSFLYLRMIGGRTDDRINIEDSSSNTIYASLLSNEFAFIPWNGTVDLYAESVGAEGTIEVGIFEI
jgi:hypothetical protein